MTHDMRRLIRIVEAHLVELTTVLNKTKTPSLPPVRGPERGEGPGPKGGEYWLNGSHLVPIQGDFAIMALLQPQTFGLTEADIMAFTEEHRYGADSLLRAFAHYHQEHSPLAFSFSGAREVGMELLFGEGWSWVRYEADVVSMQCFKQFAAKALRDMGRVLPMMQIEELKVMVIDGEVFKPEKQTHIRFAREDFPGFAGPFGAAMAWAKTGQVPEQNWRYVVVKDPDIVRSQGLKAKGPGFLSIGNWTERNVYMIDYYTQGLVDGRRFAPSGTMMRFPSSVVQGIKADRNGENRYFTLYSKQPFRIAPADLQVKSGTGWTPLFA